MTKPISKLFEDAQAACVEWEGEPLYGLYEITHAPNSLIVEFLHATDGPVQGLTIKADGGVLAVNGIEAKEMLLWHDTAPKMVSVHVKSEQGKNVRLKLWNVWRGSMGGVDVTQAWLGNSGMRIEQLEGDKVLLLRCSDGEGPVEFSDLEARVTFD